MNSVDQQYKEGSHPLEIGTFKNGFTIMGESQFIPGYCLYIPNGNYKQLDNVPMDLLAEMFKECTIVHNAIKIVYQPLRVNVCYLCNRGGDLMWHLHPRYASEGENNVRPVWRPYTAEQMTSWGYEEGIHGGKRLELIATIQKLKLQYKIA
jgi:diadenosine tetraphosphate (Ap4A) HIT family hydrolase